MPRIPCVPFFNRPTHSFCTFSGTWQIIGTLKGAAPPSEALECETTSFDMWGTCPESEDWLRRTPPITFAEMALLDMAAPKTFVEMAADLYGMIADLFR